MCESEVLYSLYFRDPPYISCENAKLGILSLQNLEKQRRTSITFVKSRASLSISSESEFSVPETKLSFRSRPVTALRARGYKESFDEKYLFLLPPFFPSFPERTRRVSEEAKAEDVNAESSRGMPAGGGGYSSRLA